MSVPAKRRTAARAKRGRAHLALKKINLTKCSKCGKPVLTHKACSFCGNYKGREAVKIKIKKEKK